MRSSGGREMERWEDQIDVDDSDLISLLRPSPPPIPSSSSSQTLHPSLQPCSQIPRSSQTPHPIPRLPLPLSERNRLEEEQKHLPKPSTSHPLIPGPAGAIQAAMRLQSASATGKRPLFKDAGSDDQILLLNEEDGDFKLNPWLCALRFLGMDSSTPCRISSINARRSGTQRIPQVVGIVKSCVLNGLGDLFIMLKDPTGTIGASIHRKVLLEGTIGAEISLGCVLILKQVVAFFPARSSCYLNVTTKNVVKLIAKDCGPPDKQVVPPFTVRSGTDWNGKQLQTQIPGGERLLKARKTADITADVQLRSNPIAERMMDIRKASHPENLSRNISSAVATENMAAKLDKRMGETKKPIFRASVAEWTDEQLDKLFSDYEDDFEFVCPST